MMPVGKVFDAAANQVLISPVSNFYQGNAIRQQLAAGEQDAELKGLQIDLAKDELENAPSAREAARRKAELQEENIRSQIDERVRSGERDELELNAKLLTPVLTDYAGEPDEDKALAKFNEGIRAILPNMSEDAQQKYMELAGPDHEFNHDEVMVAGLGVRAFMDATAGQKAQFIGDDGRPHSGTYDPNTRQYTDAAGKVHLNASPIAPGATQTELGTDPRTNSQRGADYQLQIDSYNTSTDIQEMISNTLPQVIDLPGTVGIKGALGQGGAGLLSSLGQEEMSEAFSQYMSGASPEEIAQIQVQLQAIRGRIIPLVTGEQGKRLSETEREIASRAVGLIESIKGPADLTRAYPQVVGAMKQLYAESWASNYRIAQRDGNIDYPYDLADEDERTELIQEFLDSGIDEQTIRRTVTRLINIQGVAQ